MANKNCKQSSAMLLPGGGHTRIVVCLDALNNPVWYQPWFIGTPSDSHNLLKIPLIGVTRTTGLLGTLNMPNSLFVFTCSVGVRVVAGESP